MTAEIRTVSTATRQFFEILESSRVSQAKIAKRVGIHVNTLQHWRTGRSSATLPNLEAALSVLGLELVIRPVSQTGS